MKMSLISNRKRPRGFSESFDGSTGVQSKSSNTTTSTIPLQFDNSGFNSSSSANSSCKCSSPIQKLNMDLSNNSDSTLNTSTNSFKINTSKKTTNFTNLDDIYLIDDDEEYENPNLLEVDEDGNEDETVNEDQYNDMGPKNTLDNLGEDSDDVIIVEERQVNPRIRASSSKSRRNNSDSLLFDHEAFAAYSMFNVNNDSNWQSFGDEVPEQSNIRSIGKIKKQRTNSLPQLPQAKCFYNKIPNNYILLHQKLGNVKTSIIPHQLNLPPCDDKEGHYIIKMNDIFANRFIIVRLLGQGTFGKVVECYDKVNREHVAIKIIRNIPKYRDAAKIELRILSTLKNFDNENLNHCIHLRECFDYRGHICIVTDLLMISLYDFLEKNKFIPFPGSHIQAISKQLIRSVTFFHDLNLIHTDLKPENILLHDDSFFKKALRSSTITSSYAHLSTDSNKKMPKFSRILKDPLIQIIDFGSAIFNDEYHSSIVSTRHYRAPEIVLGTGWSFPCDIWSVGCILVELVIGEPLFKTHDNLEHLAMIEKVCGSKIDKSIVRLSRQRNNECGLKYFRGEFPRADELPEFDEDDDVIIDDETTEENNLTLIFPSSTTPTKFIKSVDQLSRIDIFVSSRIGLDINFDYSLSTNFQKNQHLINFGNFTFWWFFIDLLKKLFVIDPQDRLTAYEALEHPWFNLGIEDEGTL
ncbi:uncharacterized protein PRCAT00002647001 [Priceomyces carsonii]|uniref:uncharacterized protein n=1 Tax=Priceomyces carsonii TaxID=28549 RepID=UPI002EDAB3E9|nr:unnamed protein product [Priceomyces carsonii]